MKSRTQCRRCYTVSLPSIGSSRSWAMGGEGQRRQRRRARLRSRWQRELASTPRRGTRFRPKVLRHRRAALRAMNRARPKSAARNRSQLDDRVTGRNTPLNVVGAPGFEPGTPSPPDWCANRAALRSANGPRLRCLDARRKGGSSDRGGSLLLLCHTRLDLKRGASFKEMDDVRN
jgi:hypothetical protein